jgi:CheY-like chemotaxis protein
MSAIRGRMLVVDDDPQVATALAGLLRQAGHVARTAETGDAALAAVRAGEVDLVLLDIGLPDQSGADVCRRIRHELGAWTLPVIAMTGYTDRARRIEMSEAGADDFIAKPVCRDELLARVTNLMTVRALYKSAEQQRQQAERECAHWRLVADCAITTATATSYAQLVEGFARVLRLELAIDDVAYFDRGAGLWTLAAASGGSLWADVHALVLRRGVDRCPIDARICDHDVLLLPVRAEGEMRGYLAVTKTHGFTIADSRMLRELTNHLGALIAKLPERGRPPSVTPTEAVTMRLRPIRGNN